MLTLPPAPKLERASMMSELEIRLMTKADAPVILPIEAHSFGRFHWSADAFRNEVSNQMAQYVVLVHKSSGDILGYAGAWFIIDEAHITTVASHPELRGLGLGELLITHLYGEAFKRGMELLTLEVRVSNFVAQNLYYKYGFYLSGRRPRYYQDTGEDALLLTTPLLFDASQIQVVNDALTHFGMRSGGLWCQGHSLADSLILPAFPKKQEGST
jgi:ribosomal-protein-alanine N-acetyltransferase